MNRNLKSPNKSPDKQNVRSDGGAPANEAHASTRSLPQTAGLESAKASQKSEKNCVHDLEARVIGQSNRERRSKTSKLFSAAAQWTSRQCGRASTFVLACFVIIIWGATGPLFHYSDTWQLVVNTGTTIITFLMVFLIQNSQNRDMSALQLKLDELIHVNKNARDKLLNLEDMTEEELDRIKKSFSLLATPQEGEDERQR